MRILQVSTLDFGGGAERVAWMLFQAYRAEGHHSWLAVGTKRSSDPDVLCMSDTVAQPSWNRLGEAVGQKRGPTEGRFPGPWRVPAWSDVLARSRRKFDRRLGIEDFNYPSTRRLLTLPPELVDVVHCHNLHGGYFDLRVLPLLSKRHPTFITLHDAWLLSGHCAHSFACERWREGCGECPDLTIYPAIERDATAYNWRRKRALYAKSQLFLSVPSAWLKRKVEQSILAGAAREIRVIPNGIDLSVFRPGDRDAVRSSLGIDRDADVLLLAANGIRRSPWKDYETLRAAIALVAARRRGRKLVFLALGEMGADERIGDAYVRFIPFEADQSIVARYYQAADLYVHSAKADTFPNVVLEALACGVPVIATAVGGIPEQVRALDYDAAHQVPDVERHPLERATGVLVAPADTEGIAAAIERLLADRTLRHRLGINAEADARERFDVKRLVQAQLRWYEDVLKQRSASVSGVADRDAHA